jgi:hypothetical protein
MALSTLNPPLPTLEDLFTLTPSRPLLKRSTRGLPAISDAISLLLRELNDHEDEAEYTCKRIAELLSKRHK